MKFRKKPVVIEAVRWAGDNPAEVWALTGQDHFDVIEPGDRGANPDMDAEVFDEIHGVWISLAAGMWVIKGVKGEFYPVAADVFTETYEPVSE